MIPKIIHYCWFGKNPLPPLALKCISSWKKFFPDYEIKQWNEDNFDIGSVAYVSEAYNMKKYAFVSDYVRFYVLCQYGGIYFDTDVEVVKNMDDILERGAFMGCEKDSTSFSYPSVAPGLGLGAEPHMPFYEKILKYYESRHFCDSNGSPLPGNVVSYTTELLIADGLKKKNEIQNVSGITVYPKDFFCPMDYVTGKIEFTENTRSIHLYSASWLPWYCKFEKWICHKMHIRYRDFLHRNVDKVKKILAHD